MSEVRITDELVLGGAEPVLLAGPCVIENDEHLLRLAAELARVAKAAGWPLVFKSSFDKANRSSLKSYRGPGLDSGLEALARVKAELGLPLIVDVHEASQAPAVAQVADILQIPAFLCRQTDLLLAAAATGKPVNIKKGQFLSPEDMGPIVDKIRQPAGGRVLVTERGTSFGYHNLVVDMRGLVVLGGLGVPVIFDATHSVQQPGFLGGATGGQRDMAYPLARAAVAVGIDGLFMEVHEDPDRAPCDGPNMLPMDWLPAMLDRLKALDEVRREGERPA